MTFEELKEETMAWGLTAPGKKLTRGRGAARTHARAAAAARVVRWAAEAATCVSVRVVRAAT